MITVTESAARQIRVAATKADADELGLRIAARRDAEGSLHYAMGFDEARGDDLVVSSEGIALVVSPAHRDLLDGMTLDYVEMSPGDFRFIFINPNDVAARAAGEGPREAGIDGTCESTPDADTRRRDDRGGSKEAAAGRASACGTGGCGCGGKS